MRSEESNLKNTGKKLKRKEINNNRSNLENRMKRENVRRENDKKLPLS